MIACVSPADDNYDETLSTLRYANRAKNIKNRPVINQDPKDAMLREYQKEIERLSQLIDQQSSSSSVVKSAISGLLPVILQSIIYYSIWFWIVIFFSIIWKLKIEEDIEREKLMLQLQYEEKLQQLRKEIEREQESNAKATTEMENLRRAYQNELQNINNSSKKVLLFIFFRF